MQKPHLPLIAYPGWLPLAWQISVANFNIWLTKYFSVEFTHYWSMQRSLVRYYREQEEKHQQRELKNEHG